MPIRPAHRRAIHALIAVAATAALASTAAAPAYAGAVEQVSRDSGPAGNAAFTSFAAPLALSPDGRTALFVDANFSGTTTQLLRRDIVTNVTHRVATLPRAQIAGVDDALRQLVLIEGDQVVLRRVDGTVVRRIATVPASVQGVSAGLSGNGKVVVVSTGTDLTWYDAASGARLRSVTGNRLALTRQGVSTDGSVVAGTRGDGLDGFYVRGSAEPVLLDAPAILSADGSTVVTSGPYPGNPITFTATADGTRTTVEAPTSASYSRPIALSADGRRLVVHADGLPPTTNLYDAATGRWRSFGGQFSRDLTGDLTGPVGRRTLFTEDLRLALFHFGGVVSGQLAVADLSGGDLPGTQEGLSASSYFSVAPPFASCEPGAGGSLAILYGRPGAWAPRPLLAQLRVTIDGKVALNRTLTKGYDPAVSPFPADADRFLVEFPGDAKSITIAAATLDAKGSISISQEVTRPIRDFC